MLGVTAAGSSLFAAVDVRKNQTKSYAGGLGVSAGLLTYSAFAHPTLLTPISLVGAAVLYGFYTDDRAILGGVSAGYAAFLLALWLHKLLNYLNTFIIKLHFIWSLITN